MSSDSKLKISAFKVGVLTVVSLAILVFSILWIKGRALASGERITVNFKDVNGMRPGSAVQLMGFRVGQVEEITPVVDSEKSYIKVKFVILEKNIEIPEASSLSIQQSGLIGEQFLEITPPQIQYLYIPAKNENQILHFADKVQMKLSDKMTDVGVVKKVEILNKNLLSKDQAAKIPSKFAYKVGYIITKPGLILPYSEMIGKIVQNEENKAVLQLSSENNQRFEAPTTNSKFTIIEPLRLSDFMELQYRSAKSFAITNEKLAEFLSDDVIYDLKESVENIKELTKNANTTVEQAQMLIETSREELGNIILMANNVSNKIMLLTDNLNSLVGDEEFKTTLVSTTKSIDRLSNNLNVLLEDKTTKETLANINETSKNLAQISSYIQDATEDPQLKAQISNTVCKLNMALDQLAITLNTVNELTTDEKSSIKSTLQDINATAKNMKKFSSKLNKRFLLFRLLF